MSASRGKKPLHNRPKAQREPFDLLPTSEKCDTFMVVFDYYTPRAHFIIVPRDKSGSKAPGAKLKIVEAAMVMVSHYNLQQSVLSLHCGKWGTDKKKSHVHLCVDVEEYLRIYDRRKDEIPNWPPSEHFVNNNREWKTKEPTHSGYVKNVRRYPFKTYFKDEVKAVRNYRQTEARTSTVGPSAIPPPFTAILYHLSEPRVGFAVKNCETARSAEARLHAQEAMIEVAKQYNLTDIHSQSEDDGCHVCLVLDEKTHG